MTERPCVNGCGRPRQTGRDVCFPCKIATVSLDPRATPTRAKPMTPRQVRAMNERVGNSNAWERGVAMARTNRDGTQMPYLDDKGNVVGLKRFAENRRNFTESRREMLAGLSSEGGS